MSLPVPLGVRVYTYGRTQFDRWITPWVSDVSFRSVIPGGFASATIKLARPRMMQTPEVVTGTATGTGTSATPDYLVATDADAADINIGDKVWIYTSGGALRFGGARFRITSKPSAFGFTNLTFTPNASAVTVSGDVMRAASPGHFQYADPAVYDEIADLFNRVQIVDLRTCEIVWEGRIEDPERNSDDDSWTLGCLGAMVVASDIQRPMFYIDSGTESWIIHGWYSGGAGGSANKLFEVSSDQQTISATWGGPAAWQWPGGADTGALYPIARHERCTQCDVYLGRFDITYAGTENITAGGTGNLAVMTDVYGGGFTGAELRVDVTTLATASVRKANPINGASSFTNATAQIIMLRGRNNNTTAGTNVTSVDNTASSWVLPRVQVQRVDVNGNALTAASDYPNDWVTVEQVVRDVVGRYLKSGWDTHNASNPHIGQVRSTDIYIDSSSVAQITNLTFFDGATAADILAELMNTNENQWWAIWESNWRATDGPGGINDSGFRFEWNKWPNGWSYMITSADGLSEKPSGENVHNFLFYQWRTSNAETFTETSDAEFRFSQTYWDAGSENRFLAANNVVRGTAITREEPTDSATAFSAARGTFAGLQRTQNSGTLTVKRPVMFHDTGATSNSGASRMLDPWQIRPGKLARITDIPIPSRSDEFVHSPEQVLYDSFNRTVGAGGWGTADSGQAWGVSSFALANFSVTGGAGQVALTPVGTRHFTNLINMADADITCQISVPATATGNFISAGPLTRRDTDSNWYLFHLKFMTGGSIDLELVKRVAGTFTTIASTTAVMTYSANTFVNVRGRNIGTSLAMKVWAINTAEPPYWHLTGTDSDLTFGQVGTHSNLQTGNTNTLPVNVKYDNYQAVGTVGDPGSSLDSVAFRVVATEYRAGDNSCTLELDQVATWRTETQIASSAAKKPAITVKG